MKVMLDGQEIDLGEIEENEDALDYAKPRKKNIDLFEDTVEVTEEELEMIRNNKNDESREN